MTRLVAELLWQLELVAVMISVELLEPLPHLYELLEMTGPMKLHFSQIARAAPGLQVRVVLSPFELNLIFLLWRK